MPTETTAADPTTFMQLVEGDEATPGTGVSQAINSSDTLTMTTESAKELEREAKERQKEYIDGQHPNTINGVWHCSNCGCPEGIAIGRRKGPLGSGSQCGWCGKFWHRHKRPRPVVYNPDPQYHLDLKNVARERHAQNNANE